MNNMGAHHINTNHIITYSIVHQEQTKPLNCSSKRQYLCSLGPTPCFILCGFVYWPSPKWSIPLYGWSCFPSHLISVINFLKYSKWTHLLFLHHVSPKTKEILLSDILAIQNTTPLKRCVQQYCRLEEWRKATLTYLNTMYKVFQPKTKD
jgi:hypothetical protein